MSAEKIFVISNSHLDPIWLWRRRSGRSAWINTAKTVVNLMEKYPFIKFSCSSSAMYRWIEECDPGLFRIIGELVKSGRWEIVGGWEVQSDTIIARGETLLRQAEIGKKYFMDKFGVDVDIAYSVDSFGHGAGIPKILNAGGFTKYIFGRPTTPYYPTPLLFDWRADDGSEVRALRLLDTYNIANISEEAFFNRIRRHINQGLNKQTMFFGVGDHGGGLSEKQLNWLVQAQKNEETEIVFATLKEYFDAVAQEELPVVKGELGRMFRGCYSNAREVKRQCAAGLQGLLCAEKLGAGAEELEPAWKELLFNHFHDILPGTSIEEAFRKDVLPSLGMVQQQANETVDRLLCRRAARENTAWMPEGGLLVRNPEPRPVKALVSVTAFADPNENGKLFNTLVDADGREYPMQLLPPPSTFGPCNAPWGNMTAVIELPASAEKFLAFAAKEPRTGKLGFETQRAFLQKISFPMFYDDSGTWGHTMEHFLHVEEEAQLVSVEEVADGPVASLLRARYTVRSSSIQLDIWHYKDLEELRLELKLEWFESRRCIKIAYEHDICKHTFYTGAAMAVVERFKNGNPRPDNFSGRSFGTWQGDPAACAESPVIDWCAAIGATDAGGTAAFYSADLHSCDHGEGKMRFTLLRPTLYADHIPFPQNICTGYQDLGTAFFELYFSKSPELSAQNLPQRAHQRLTNVEVWEVTRNTMPDDSIAANPVCPALDLPESVVIESLRYLGNGSWKAHLMNYGDKLNVDLPGIGTVELAAGGLKQVVFQEN